MDLVIRTSEMTGTARLFSRYPFNTMAPVRNHKTLRNSSVVQFRQHRASNKAVHHHLSRRQRPLRTLDAMRMSETRTCKAEDRISINGEPPARITLKRLLVPSDQLWAEAPFPPPQPGTDQLVRDQTNTPRLRI